MTPGRAAPVEIPPEPTLRFGVRANLFQFTLLVLVTAFVGAMVGMERAVLPLLAERDFQLASKTAILSFLLSFGVVKALMNLAAGRLCDRWGRKPVLVWGWAAGLPVPWLIILAPAWSWVVFANMLLGLQQGLCWSTTIIMKTDIAGRARRGLALGWNEAVGYSAVSAAAYLSAWVAAQSGLRPWPFSIGVASAVLGLAISALLIEETDGHMRLESGHTPEDVPWSEVFARTSRSDRTLSTVCAAGLTVNLNDGVAWGLLPLLFAGGGLSVARIGLLAALYPGVRGVSQLGAGWLSDRVGRKPLIVAGLWSQAAAIELVAGWSGLAAWTAGVVLLGLGVAMVYPTLLAAVSDAAAPQWRASAVGVYRFWRDSGYAAGALGAGVLADWLSLRWAIGAAGALTFLAGLAVWLRMRETLRVRA